VKSKKDEVKSIGEEEVKSRREKKRKERSD
jgi:hypothetical protein